LSALDDWDLAVVGRRSKERSPAAPRRVGSSRTEGDRIHSPIAVRIVGGLSPRRRSSQIPEDQRRVPHRHPV